MKKNWCYYLLPVVLMLAIPFQTAADDFLRGDCNQDGNVSIADVTCLIDYLLSQEWPEEQPSEPENVTFVVNGIEINMVYVEGGTYTMGASGADTEAADDEFPAHILTVNDYYICTTEVTQQLWRAVMGNNPSNFTNNVLCPVEMVSWNDCKTFITKLNAMTGQTFRLPTEAEWEFAARGGNKSQGNKYSGSNNHYSVAWCGGIAKTQQVATKSPNELGLYDMSGNVWEWCSDWYSLYNATTSGLYRVRRGGSYSGSATYCRVSSREKSFPESRYNNVGLRLAMSYPN